MNKIFHPIFHPCPPSGKNINGLSPKGALRSMCCCPLPSSSASSPVNTFAGRAHRGLRVIELPAFPRRDCITARQRKRAKWCRLACGTPLLTCPRTQRAPPNRAALRLQLWISLDCVTARQRKRAKWCRLACGTPLLTCPRTQKAQPNRAALRLQLWISLQKPNSPQEA